MINKQWEYCWTDSRGEIEELGNLGWELVSVTETMTNWEYQDNQILTTFYFKRPKQTEINTNE